VGNSQWYEVDSSINRVCCLITSAAVNNQWKTVNLHATLLAIEIGLSTCEVCMTSSSEDLFSFHHFNIAGCTIMTPTINSNVVQNIATSCKKHILHPKSIYQHSSFIPSGISL